MYFLQNLEKIIIFEQLIATIFMAFLLGCVLGLHESTDDPVVMKIPAMVILSAVVVAQLYEIIKVGLS